MTSERSDGLYLEVFEITHISFIFFLIELLSRLKCSRDKSSCCYNRYESLPKVHTRKAEAVNSLLRFCYSLCQFTPYAKSSKQTCCFRLSSTEKVNNKMILSNNNVQFEVMTFFQIAF